MSTVALIVNPATIQRGESFLVVAANGSPSGVASVTLNGAPCAVLLEWTSSSRYFIAAPPWSLGAGTYTLAVTYINGDTGSSTLTVTAPSATRFYLTFDSTTNGVAQAASPAAIGARYPTSEQAAATADLSSSAPVAAAYVLKSQKGQAGAKNEVYNTALPSVLGYQRVYVKAFHTLETANLRSIRAGTWKFRAASKVYSTSGMVGIPDKLALYVWRPGEGAGVGVVVGTIFDNTADDSARLCGARTETKSSVAFDVGGGEVTGIQDGDVIVLEWWSTYNVSTTTTNKTLYWYFGGLADPSGTDLTTFSDATGAASYLEAPTDLWAPSAARPQVACIT